MRVVILSKAPIAGKVKTRLMPEYTAEQAANLHKQMVKTVVMKVCSIFDDVWLAVDDIEHPFFQALLQKFTCKLKYQGAGDLGQRLQALAAASFAKDDAPIIFLGADSPHVAIERYQQAIDALTRHDVVIGPVEDGGYDLIAIRNDYPELFQNIDWGSNTVFDKTMNNINKLRLNVKVLDKSFDLDFAKDLRRALPDTW